MFKNVNWRNILMQQLGSIELLTAPNQNIQSYLCFYLIMFDFHIKTFNYKRGLISCFLTRNK